MPSNIEVRNFEPQIEVNIVLLAAAESFIFLAARPRHDQELVVETAN